MAGLEQKMPASGSSPHDETRTASHSDTTPATTKGLTATGPLESGPIASGTLSPARLPPARLPQNSSRTTNLLLCICENVQVVKRDVVPVLQEAGYEVDLVEASMRRPLPLSARPYRLLLFDVGSKSDNDYQICAQTRLASQLPIMLMLRGAARNEVVRGFQAGADAYVLVPFDPRELLVRMDALLRRPAAPPIGL